MQHNNLRQVITLTKTRRRDLNPNIKSEYRRTHSTNTSHNSFRHFSTKRGYWKTMLVAVSLGYGKNPLSTSFHLWVSPKSFHSRDRGGPSKREKRVCPQVVWVADGTLYTCFLSTPTMTLLRWKPQLIFVVPLSKSSILISCFVVGLITDVYKKWMVTVILSEMMRI